MPGELVLPIVRRVILFGIIAAPTGDVDGEGVGATVRRRGLDGEIAPTRGRGEEVGGAPGGERAGALAVEGVGKEDRACVCAGGRDVVDVERTCCPRGVGVVPVSQLARSVVQPSALYP